MKRCLTIHLAEELFHGSFERRFPARYFRLGPWVWEGIRRNGLTSARSGYRAQLRADADARSIAMMNGCDPGSILSLRRMRSAAPGHTLLSNSNLVHVSPSSALFRGQTYCSLLCSYVLPFLWAFIVLRGPSIPNLVSFSYRWFDRPHPSTIASAISVQQNDIMLKCDSHNIFSTKLLATSEEETFK